MTDDFELVQMQFPAGSCLADATVAIGPVRLWAQLSSRGELMIDDALNDPGLRARIAIALRNVVLAAMATHFNRLNERDLERFNKHRAEGKHAKATHEPS
jgi:hypothetical protein